MTTPQLKIVSLNIASSFRDEATNPLHKRLNAISALLGDVYQNRCPFDMLCIQEVRASGSYTSMELIVEIYKMLRKIDPLINWEFNTQFTNMTVQSFRRVIFWNAQKYSLCNTDAIYIPNRKEPLFEYMIAVHQFTQQGTSGSRFRVMNVHAPLRIEEKQEYWKMISTMIDAADEFHTDQVMVIGDMNKFETEQHIFQNVLSYSYGDIHDLILPDMKTFYSFDSDLKPDGITHWESSLDSVIVRKGDVCTVDIVSTKDLDPRPTDHFCIIAKWNLSE